MEPEPEPDESVPMHPDRRRKAAPPAQLGHHSTVMADAQHVDDALACVRARQPVPPHCLAGIQADGPITRHQVGVGCDFAAALAAYSCIIRGGGGALAASTRRRALVRQAAHLVFALAGNRAGGQPLDRPLNLEEQRLALQGWGFLSSGGRRQRFTFHVVSPFERGLPAGIQMAVVGSLRQLGDAQRALVDGTHRMCRHPVPLDATVLEPSSRPRSRSRVLEATLELPTDAADGVIDWKLIKQTELRELPVEKRKDVFEHMKIALRVAQFYWELGDDANALACCRQGLKLRKKAEEGMYATSGYMFGMGAREAKYFPQEVQSTIRDLNQLQTECEATWFRFTTAIIYQGQYILHQPRRQDWQRVLKTEQRRRQAMKFVEFAEDEPFPLSQLRQPALLESCACEDEGENAQPRRRMLAHAFWWLVEERDRNILDAYEHLRCAAVYQRDRAKTDTAEVRLQLLQSAQARGGGGDGGDAPLVDRVQLQQGVVLLWLVAGFVLQSNKSLSAQEMQLLCECIRAPAELDWVRKLAGSAEIKCQDLCKQLHGCIMRVAKHMAQDGVVNFLRVLPLLNLLDPRAALPSDLTIHDASLSASHMLPRNGKLLDSGSRAQVFDREMTLLSEHGLWVIDAAISKVIHQSPIVSVGTVMVCVTCAVILHCRKTRARRWPYGRRF